MMILICAILALILITVFTEKGEGWWSVVTLLGLGVVIFLGEKTMLINTWDYIRENTGLIIMYAIVYIIVGIFWAMAKWRWYCIELYEIWNTSISRSGTTIEARNHAGKITVWMAWWPMSLGWWLLHDPITRFYKFLHKKLSRVFDSISESAKSSVQKSK